MPKHFYFLRHAETEANQKKIICGGGVDTPLTELGLKQARQAQEIFYSHHKINPASVVIHSDMKRTRKTAEIVNQTITLPIITNSNLKEHIVGEWEGKNLSDILESYMTFQDPPNGETFHDFKTRVYENIFKHLNPTQIPLIVAHGGVWRAFLSWYHINPTRHPQNAELFYFEYMPHNEKFPWRLYDCLNHGEKRIINL